MWQPPLLTLLLLLLLSTLGVEGWNVGEIIPVTLHMRLKRVSPNIVVGRNDMDDVNDMRDFDQGEQFLRPLPPDFCPRFGINRRVHQPAKLLFEHARRHAKVSGRSLSDVAVRFQLERGLSKSTAWLPLLKSTVRTPLYGVKTPPKKTSQDEHVLHLAAVTFSFGYQEGTFNKITAFHAEAVYATVQHDEIEIQYRWEEHRAYNSHRALSVCAFVSVFATIAVLYVIVFAKNSLSKELRQRHVTLRNHRE
ncbi:hypothetical protein TraAM80_04579 [Trypanosoma rangeli]|uniref:Uncharacterized protein n=1 Tax=Trypanosoma rangeli TaxID=5698 RepID=A0A3S5IR94_TRYRA|nr:uncharacterized protein TraAM80_04579 [Trypanosoma rangeli]RNF05288.1 hypothetical protein TraAM80_04579 [Trypanosoma rangeli]|eukprot:RNF05288.1 hypothetical protein TraAM80_04579 [Trypanosoma rangeli]